MLVAERQWLERLYAALAARLKAELRAVDGERYYLGDDYFDHAIHDGVCVFTVHIVGQRALYHETLAREYPIGDPVEGVARHLSDEYYAKREEYRKNYG